ncbi:MAG: flagellar basal body L-ring protein FlgH [Alphaproteobacteria bacterium]|nr:flagellar basal body L-ring protein FlgH [Alphaproteobacteria bacterium]
MTRLAPFALLAALAGCASAGAAGDAAFDAAGDFATRARTHANTAIEAAQRAAAPPPLGTVTSPSPLAGADYGAMPQPIAASAAQRAPSSLWQSGARSFFNDARASRIGDILTVNVEITDKAEVTNSSARSRSGSTTVGVNNFFGLENIPGRILPGGYDPSALIDAEGASSQAGQGSIAREEKITMTVAAVVVDILPNGNFVIAGRQQVRINAELRELTVTGVIRPEDIAADNTIRNDQIAEARIDYGGRGQVSAVQRPRLGQRVGDAISPW